MSIRLETGDSPPRSARSRSFLPVAIAACCAAVVAAVVSLSPTAAAEPGWAVSSRLSTTEVAPGGSVDIVATVASTTWRPQVALVDIEVYSTRGDKVFQAYWDEARFAPSVPRSFTGTWNLPADLSSGTYYVKYGIFTTAWTSLISWTDDPQVVTVSGDTATPGSSTTATSGPVSTAAPPTGASSSTTSTSSVAPTTSTSSPAATSPASTSTTGPQQPPVGSVGCGLAAPAFCETFSIAKPDSVSRTGDLDETLWGVSRLGKFDSWSSATLNGRSVLPPNDVRIIDGQLVEAANDDEYQTTLAMYPKQPFDFAGRTGVVTFDVSANSEGIHAAWPEFWITDQPVPAPHGTLSAQDTFGRNSVGFSIAAQCSGPGAGQTGGTSPYVGIDRIMTTRDYQFNEVTPTSAGCVKKATGTSLNHFEVRISDSRIEVWGTDAGSTTLRLLSFADVSMPLTKGLVWLEDIHYNAGKFDSQRNHQFVWDNVGFDGPKTYRDYTYDVPDNLAPIGGDQVHLSYELGREAISFTLRGVAPQHAPSAAYVLLNYVQFEDDPPPIEVSVNGGPWHAQPSPWSSGYTWRTIAIEVDLADVRVGDNTIRLRKVSGSRTEVANINLLLVNAAAVP